MLQEILLGAVFSFGIMLLYNSLFIQPAKAAVQAVAKVHNFTLKTQYEHLLDYISKKLNRFVKISQYKRNEYLRMLEVLELHYTPEEYTSRIMSKAICFFVVGLSLGILSPILLLLAPVCAATIYFSENSSLQKKYIKRKNEIELDLPKLCSVINSRLQSTANVQSILTSFLPIANASMSAELKLTLADMKTGNVETALRRFESRISSPKVSDVVRGLIAVQNGDDLRVFFQSKQHQFNNDYLTVKRKSILARPMELVMPGLFLFAFFGCIIGYSGYIGMKQMMSGTMLL
ncbi:MAG: hypothetical protein RR115_03440 [Hydrogenoanaerobacterium sp.]